MSVPIVETYDVASLEAFTADLVGAGFEPVPGTGRRAWRSPIHPAFSALTTAATMDLILLDGWPYEPPALLVKGLDTNHYTLDGLVCMWRDGDASFDWTAVEGLFARIEKWCADAEHGWDTDDLGRDALLNFKPKDRTLAVFNLPELGTARSSWGDFRGELHVDPFRVDLTPGRAREPSQLVGLWFRVGALRVPPRQLSELRRCLPRSQWKGLERRLAARRRAEALTPSGGADLILLCWERGAQLDVLVIACRGTGDNLEGVALQAVPNDQENLILRAGPDAESLRSRRVAIFGAGALGGHVAVTLAESGAGFIRLVDADALTPGNVVRHVAGRDAVGAAKVHAVQAAIRAHAPWSEVEALEEAPIRPSRIDALIADVDVVVDATGNAATTYAVAARARTAGRSFVSGALYRGGRISRVRRYARADDTPLDERDSPQYPLIPPDADEDVARAAVGCSAPVNNAPPSAILAGASLLAQGVIDVLTDRFELPDEIVDVYRALPEEPPFDRVGRVH
ncbi:MAG: ThiF family adenylyltransferase [Thermoflexaceae bacterium]|nr:ThiF family adenylyltransferase [Thermoflexaceae bacterium]